MISISYRREDSVAIAGRLYDRLQSTFGRKNVFMDFDSIPAGVDFREHIARTIEQSDVVLALIGPNWVGGGDVSRRIDDPGDFVRMEVDTALQKGIPVIPVLLNRTEMPKADLPCFPPKILRSNFTETCRFGCDAAGAWFIRKREGGTRNAECRRLSLLGRLLGDTSTE